MRFMAGCLLIVAPPARSLSRERNVALPDIVCKNRAELMAEEASVTLMEAARQYLAALPSDQRIGHQAEVERFARWCGADRACAGLRGQEIANYADTLTGTLTDASRRADVVKSFLAFAKKAGFTSTNLGAHLRLRKAAGRATPRAGREVQLSEQEHAALNAELEGLKALRPRIIQDIQHAMADKDFRENAPLDAARQQQGHVEGRIRTIEGMLANAVVVQDERSAGGHVVEIGCTALVRNLASGKELSYTLVRPGEVNPAQGRISFQSPVGKALLMHRAGDEVEVEAPSGTLRLQILRVED
jgi:transcription elongation factor GreA